MSKAKRILELYWDGKLSVGVRKIYSKLKVNIDNIARLFRVSEAAILQRVNDLCIFEERI